MKIQNMRNNKAITLIALVVTIVVLLILAGTSIAMLSGENGIITQAQDAEEDTRGASAKEEIDLWKSNVKMDKLTASRTAEKQKDLLDRLVENGKLTQDEANDLEAGKTIIIGKYEISLDETITGEGEVPVTLIGLRDKENPVEGNTTLEDENGDKITIPDGFNVDKDSPIKVQEGIVIEDSYDNEYVWIPVFEKSEERTWGADYSAVTTAKTAERGSFTTADYTAIQTVLNEYTATYSDSNNSDAWYGDEIYGQYGYYDGTKFNYYTNGNMSQTEYETLYNNMLVSIYKNGGFYIGRYEMGTGVATSVETAESLTRTIMTEYIASSYTNTNTIVIENAIPSIEGMPIPVSKANAVGYTFITQNQAQMLAKKMSETYKYGTTTSSLMFGVQWKSVCVFIEKYGKLSNGTQFNSNYLKYNEYGKLWGNYSSSTYKMEDGYYKSGNANSSAWKEKAEKISGSEQWLCTTGASSQNRVLNIYDFGGNLDEYTLERANNPATPVTIRGGGFNSIHYVCVNTRSAMHYNMNITSARPSLFL